MAKMMLEIPSLEALCLAIQSLYQTQNPILFPESLGAHCHLLSISSLRTLLFQPSLVVFYVNILLVCEYPFGFINSLFHHRIFLALDNVLHDNHSSNNSNMLLISVLQLVLMFFQCLRSYFWLCQLLAQTWRMPVCHITFSSFLYRNFGHGDHARG